MCVQLYFFYLLTSLYVAYAHRIIDNSVLMPLLVELLYYSELYLVEYTLTQYPHGYMPHGTQRQAFENSLALFEL